MNQLNFSMLGIIIQSESDILIDDGFTPDIEAHTDEINKKHHASSGSVYEGVPSPYTPKGRVTQLVEKPSNQSVRNTYIIFYEHSDQPTELHVRGSLETKVLHLMGKIGLLQERLQQLGLKIDLEKYKDYGGCTQQERELVAHVGGFYVMQKNNVMQKNRFDVSAFPINMLCPGYRPALVLYQKALNEKNK